MFFLFFSQVVNENQGLSSSHFSVPISVIDTRLQLQLTVEFKSLLKPPFLLSQELTIKKAEMVDRLLLPAPSLDSSKQL